MQLRSYSTFGQPQEKWSHCLKKHFLQPTSKSLVQVLLWSATVGFINSIINASPYFALSRLYNDQKLLLYVVMCLYIVLAVAMMCYPLGGLLADVYFGRYKIIRASLIMIALSMLVTLVELVGTIQFGVNENSHVWKKIMYVVGGISAFLLLAIGLAGLTSNNVQFGLDQVFDAPSNKLGAFVHIYVWAYRVGYTAFDTIYTIKHCYYGTSEQKSLTNGLLYGLPGGEFVVLVALILLSCYTHKTFNKERVKYNPYKMILRVLNFARKHKCPVGHPSAFAYCDNFQPSRMDFAKQRFGGPFTTADVEDVKTSTRVFLLLLALGPVFVVVVPTSFYLFTTFAIHTGTHTTSILYGKFSATWVILQSGLLSGVISTLVLPLYTWLFFFVFVRKNMLPKILHRVQFAATLLILSPVSMMAVDLTGHILRTNAGDNNQTCMFLQQYVANATHLEPLYLHWSVLIVPNLTKALALDLIMASTFEFISAQSPHTMKGVLVGVLFAVRGFFQLMEAVLLFPFSVKHIWSKFAKETPVISCEFSYYLVTSFIALVGLVLLMTAARKYQYRKREEEPYSQSRVEEIFDRMFRERDKMLVSRHHPNI